MPDRISFAQGAAIGTPYGTAYRALFQRAEASRGDTVLIHGATGGVGIAAVQLARAAGLTIIGTGGSQKGLELIKQQGAHRALNHREENYLDQIFNLTGGRGVDIVVEMLANINLGKDLKVLAQNGRVVVVGSRGKVEVDPRDAMNRDAAILGMLLGNTPPDQLSSIYAAINKGLVDGTLNPVVGKEIPLAEAPRAHQEVMRAGAYGKIVLIP